MSGIIGIARGENQPASRCQRCTGKGEPHRELSVRKDAVHPQKQNRKTQEEKECPKLQDPSYEIQDRDRFF
jgi:hypothetical protein